MARKWLFLLLLITGLSVCIFTTSRLSVNIDLLSILQSDSEDRVTLEKFYKTFPPEEGDITVTVTFENPITIADIRKSKIWLTDLKNLSEVKTVVSHIELLLEVEYESLSLNEWIDLTASENLPIKFGDDQAIDMIMGNFISDDMRSLAFYVQKKGGDFNKFVESVRAETDTWEVETRILGTNVMLMDSGSLLLEELGSLLTRLFIALAIVVPLFLRSFRLAYLPIFLSVLSVLVFLSLLVLMGESMTLMFISSPILIIVISISNSIHMLRYFENARSKGSDVLSSLCLMYEKGSRACFLTSLTTAIGFFSLLIVQHDEIRNYGLWSGIGVTISYLVIMGVFPIVLTLFPGKLQNSKSYRIKKPQHFYKFFIPVCIMIALSLYGLTQVRFETSIYNEMPQEAQPVKDLEWFSNNFKGTERIEIEVHGSLRDHEVLQAVETLQKELGKVAGVKKSLSYANLIRYATPAALMDIPDGPEMALYALSALPVFPENLLNRDANHACIIFYTTKEFGSSQYRAFVDRFNDLKPTLTSKADFDLNGFSHIAFQNLEYIKKSLLLSLGVSTLAVTLTLIITFRSWLLGLICLVPNSLPIVATFGLAGWFDFPISFGAIVIFTIGLGLAVDDTVHLMLKFMETKKSDKFSSISEVINETVSSTGFSIILTSIVLLTGSFTFFQSSFVTMRETGMVMSSVTLLAILCDLCLFPRLLQFYYFLKNKQPS